MKKRTAWISLLLIVCLIMSLMPPLNSLDVQAAGDRNLALGKRVTFSSSYDAPAEGWSASFLVDGSRSGPRAPGSNANGWTSFPRRAPLAPGETEWVKVDLETAGWIDRIVLWPRSDNGTSAIGAGFPVDFKVQVSADDANWTTVAEYVDFQAPNVDGESVPVVFDSLLARYVKVEATRLAPGAEYVMQFRELEVFQVESTASDEEAVAIDLENLDIPIKENVMSDLTLPTVGVEGSAISWQSSHPEILAADGRVNRPTAGSGVASVELTATIMRGDHSRQRTFTVTVLPHREREEAEEEFLIGIFWPPTWDFTNDEQYRILKEGNIDVIQNVLGSFLDTEERNKKMLELGERHGLKINVADPRIRGTDEQIREVVETYKDYWATGGYYIRDEPNVSELPREAHIYREVLKHDDTKNPYVNLFPRIYGEAHEREYVRAWVEEVGPENLRYLSYDDYPFMVNGGFKNDYYETADIMRRVGLDYDIKTAAYLQSVGYGPNASNMTRRTPSEADMTFSVYSYLAYGFKYVTWFTYWTPTGRGEYFTDAIIDPQGNKTVRYEPFQRLNGEMKQLGKTLIKLDAREVFHAGPTRPGERVPGIPANFYVQPANESDQIILSYLRHREDGSTYVMAVNKSLTEPKSLSFDIDDRVTAVYEVSKQTGEPIAAEYDSATGKLNGHFQAGEGKLFKLIGDLPMYTGPQRIEPAPSDDQEPIHPLTNLAYRKPVAASSNIGDWGWDTQYLVDGERIGGSSAYAPKGWSNLPVTVHPDPQWVQIDLGQTRKVNRVDLWPRNDNGTAVGIGFPVDFHIEVSLDERNWTRVYESFAIERPEDGRRYEALFEPIDARFVKIVTTRLYHDPNSREFLFQLAEAEVYQQDPGTRLELRAEKTDLLVGQSTKIDVFHWAGLTELTPVHDALFASERPDVLSVGTDGTVTAVGEGKGVVTVTLQLPDGSSDQHSIELTVRNLAEPWELHSRGNADAILIPQGEALEMRAKGGAAGDSVWVKRPVEGERSELSAVIARHAIPDLPEAAGSRSGLMYATSGGEQVALGIGPDGRMELAHRTPNEEERVIKGDYASFPVSLKLVQEGERFTGLYLSEGKWLPIFRSEADSTVQAASGPAWEAGAFTTPNTAGRRNQTIFERLLLSKDARQDREPPEWPANARLEAVERTTNSIGLRWPEAMDDQAVLYYALEYGDKRISVTDATYRVTGLQPGTSYSFQVRAIDASDNASVPLSLRVSTLSERGSGGGAPQSGGTGTPGGDGDSQGKSYWEDVAQGLRLKPDAIRTGTGIHKGEAIAAISFDEDTWIEGFGQLAGKSADKRTMTIAVDDERAIMLQMPLTVLKEGLKQAPGAMVVLQLGTVAYELPLDLYDYSSIAVQSDAAERASLNLTIRVLEGEERQAIEQLAASTGATLISDAAEFDVFVDADGRRTDLNSFAGRKVKRVFRLTGAVDPAFNTGVLIEHGELAFVPSLFERQGTTANAVLMNDRNSVYAVVEHRKTFRDIAQHWAKADIELLASKLLMRGVSESEYAPERDITRAELTALLARSLGLRAEANGTTFSDVPANAWYANDVYAAAEAGLAMGYTDGTFRPGQTITREETAVLISRAIGYAGKASGLFANAELLAAFSDQSRIGGWARDELSVAVQAGIVQGMPDGAFRPQQQASRAETAAMLKRLLQFVGYIDRA